MLSINDIDTRFDFSGSTVRKSLRSSNATFYFFHIEESEINGSLVLTDVRIFHERPTVSDCKTGYDSADDARIRLARVGQEIRFEGVVLNTRLVLVDYGYRLWYSIIWAFAFLITGTVVFFNTREIGRPRLSDRKLNAADRVAWAIIYSFDMLLPVVKLKESNYDVDLSSKAQYYLYLHKITGWVLGTFILAGLTGWARSI